MKYVYLTSLIFLFSKSIYAQNVEEDIFKSICFNLIEENENVSAKKQLTGVSLLIDPIKDDTTIKYTVNNAAIAKFKGYSKGHQIEILTCSDLSIFPLKNTVYILDTLGFFSEGIHLNAKGYSFKIVRSIHELPSSRSMYLYKIGVRQNDLALSFGFFDNKFLKNYYFKLPSASLKISRSTIVEVKSSIE